MRPTGRAVLIFACGIPLALLVVVYDSSLWALSFNYGLLTLLVIGTDALLVLSPRQLQVVITVPDRLYIGESGSIGVTLRAAGRWATRLAALSEQEGEAEPARLVLAQGPPGREARVALPLIPRRRGPIAV